MEIVNTLKCNFRCKHCCYSCGPRRKEMLQTSDLLRYLDLGLDNEFCNYCGGETFLNPEWDQQIRILTYSVSNLRIVTNGSLFYTRSGNETKLLKKLINSSWESYSRDCRISIQISNDVFHREEYEQKNLYPLRDVIRRFKNIEWPENIEHEDDSRDRMKSPFLPLGRARKFNLSDSSGKSTKGCQDSGNWTRTLWPDSGNIYGCPWGMKRIFLGNARTGNILGWKEIEKKKCPSGNCGSCRERKD